MLSISLPPSLSLVHSFFVSLSLSCLLSGETRVLSCTHARPILPSFPFFRNSNLPRHKHKHIVQKVAVLECSKKVKTDHKNKQNHQRKGNKQNMSPCHFIKRQMLMWQSFRASFCTGWECLALVHVKSWLMHQAQSVEHMVGSEQWTGWSANTLINNKKSLTITNGSSLARDWFWSQAHSTSTGTFSYIYSGMERSE